MSDENDNLPSLPNLAPVPVKEEPVTDISNEDLEKVNKFIEDGMPGLGLVDDGKMYRMMELYLSGKTYTQIARASRINKTMLLYLAHKFNWYGRRREFLTELESTMRIRLMEAKVVSHDFLLQLATLWQTKIGNKIEAYAASGDEAMASSIDLKEVDKYLKVVEMIHKIGPEGAKKPREQDDRPSVSPVTINLGNQGVTISTPMSTIREKTTADMLKQFADFKRAEEEKNIDSKKKN